MPVVVEDASEDRFEEDLRIDLTGDVDPVLSVESGGLFSISSSLPLSRPRSWIVEPSAELTEFLALRPPTAEADSKAAVCERPLSVLDGGRGGGLVRLPFGVCREAEDTVDLEAFGVAGFVLVSLIAMIGFGGMPFLGDGLCRLS